MNLIDIVQVFILLPYAWALNEKKISIGVLVSSESNDRECTLKAVKMATDDVNAIDKFLFQPFTNTEYKFIVTTKEVTRNKLDVVEAMYKMYYNNKNGPMVSVIGPPHNEQISYAGDYAVALGTYTVSYSEAYEPWPQNQNFFRQISPSILSRYETGRIIADHFRWQKLGMIYDYSEGMYQKNSDVFRNELNRKVVGSNYTMKVLSDHGIWSDPIDYKVTQEFNDIQEKGVRVIFALVSTAGARKIFCEAYHRKMFVSKVVWLLFEILPQDWASDKYNSDLDKHTKQPKREINCTEKQLLRTSSGYIAITRAGLRKDGVRTVSNMTAEEFRSRLQSDLKPETECHENVAYAYDAVWATAYAHRAFLKVKFPEPIDGFLVYERINETRAFFGFKFQDAIPAKAIEFEGLTGPVSYVHGSQGHKNHRIGRLSIWGNRDNKATFVGTYDTESNNLTMTPNHKTAMFKNGIVPKDKAVYEKKFVSFSNSLFVTMWIIACVGVVIGMMFLFLVFALILKRNSNVCPFPLIDCTLVLGCNLCYASVVIYGLDNRFISVEDTRYVCWGFVITLSLGFALAFGSLFAKAWRLYKKYVIIDENDEHKVKENSEFTLLVILSVLVLIDGIILGIWYNDSPFDYKIENIATDDDLFEDVIHIKQLTRCSCKHKDEFAIGIYCVKGAMLICAIFLSWQTKSGKKQTNNKSHQNTMAIYNVATLSLIGIISATVLGNTTQYEALYAVIAVCICTCTTSTLFLVFIPRIRKLINSCSMSMNNSQRKSNNPDYNMGHINRRMERPSTGEKSDEMHQHFDSIDSSMAVGSVVSMNPNYLSSSPPSFGSYEEQRRNGDATGGTLNVAFRVDRIDEEPESDYRNKIKEESHAI